MHCTFSLNTLTRFINVKFIFCDAFLDNRLWRNQLKDFYLKSDCISGKKDLGKWLFKDRKWLFFLVILQNAVFLRCELHAGNLIPAPHCTFMLTLYPVFISIDLYAAYPVIGAVLIPRIIGWRRYHDHFIWNHL